MILLIVSTLPVFHAYQVIDSSFKGHFWVLTLSKTVLNLVDQIKVFIVKNLIKSCYYNFIQPF